jgi:pyruvate dehydrogenase complex dehydrogenase (E1) component
VLFAHNIYAGALSNTTQYLGFVISGQDAEADAASPMPIGGEVRAMAVRQMSTQPATGTLIVTLRKNLANTPSVITIAADQTATTHLNTSTVTFAAGDRIAIRISNNAGSTSARLDGVALSVVSA